MEQSAFSKRLARVIEQAGISQAEFAARVGVSPSTISLWLHGHLPRLDTYERALAEIKRLEARNERKAS